MSGRPVADRLAAGRDAQGGPAVSIELRAILPELFPKTLKVP
jgi:hypothetical protein